MKLQRDMVAVITGAASGIGFEFARALAQRGLRVVLSDIEGEALDRALSAFPPGRAVGFRADVGRIEDVEALRDRSLEAFGRVDLICNNAGVFAGFAPMWTFDLRDWQWSIQVNLWGVIHGIRTFVPLLVEQGRGHVVNVASLAGLVSGAGNAPYNVAKHGVVTLSEGLLAELRQQGVDVGVTLCCPGGVRTNIRDAARNRPAEFAAGPNPHLINSADKSDRSLPKDSPVIVDITPDLVARQMMDAVEAGRLYCATHEGFPDLIRARMEALVAGMSVV